MRPTTATRARTRSAGIARAVGGARLPQLGAWVSATSSRSTACAGAAPAGRSARCARPHRARTRRPATGSCGPEDRPGVPVFRTAFPRRSWAIPAGAGRGVLGQQGRLGDGRFIDELGPRHLTTGDLHRLHLRRQLCSRWRARGAGAARGAVPRLRGRAPHPRPVRRGPRHRPAVRGTAGQLPADLQPEGLLLRAPEPTCSTALKAAGLPSWASASCSTAFGRPGGELTEGLEVRDAHGVFRRDTIKAYGVLAGITWIDPSRPGSPVVGGSESGSLSGLSSKLSPPRRLLFLVCIALALWGVVDLPGDGVGPLPVGRAGARGGRARPPAGARLADRCWCVTSSRLPAAPARAATGARPEVEGYSFAFSYRTANTSRRLLRLPAGRGRAASG